jgi:hypothetical protein
MSMRQVRINVPDLQLPDNRVSNTRYTRWNFLFKTLAQQFSKPMNRYFLLIAFLQLDASLTPVNPASTWGPLIIVTLVSMIKEAVDDSKRAESDRVANERLYSIGGYGGDGAAARSVRAAEIRVGQLVCVLRDEEVPCDLVLLQTSEAPGLGAGICYVQTTNIDGEADLKVRRALAQTQAVPRAQLHELRGTVECALPNAAINEFDSTLVLDSTVGAPPLGLSVEHLLLQATHVRKTDWVVGLAVYTGNQTKLGCNKGVPPFKYSAAEQLVNRFSVAIFYFQLFLALALGLRGAAWRLSVGKSLAYLGYEHSSREPESVYFVVLPLRFLLLVSLMIPISLAVTLDILRWACAREPRAARRPSPCARARIDARAERARAPTRASSLRPHPTRPRFAASPTQVRALDQLRRADARRAHRRARGRELDLRARGPRADPVRVHRQDGHADREPDGLPPRQRRRRRVRRGQRRAGRGHLCGLGSNLQNASRRAARRQLLAVRCAVQHVPAVGQPGADEPGRQRSRLRVRVAVARRGGALYGSAAVRGRARGARLRRRPRARAARAARGQLGEQPRAAVRAALRAARRLERLRRALDAAARAAVHVGTQAHVRRRAP